MERWAEQVAAEAGFTAVDHTIELFGLCPQCSKDEGSQDQRGQDERAGESLGT